MPASYPTALIHPSKPGVRRQPAVLPPTYGMTMPQDLTAAEPCLEVPCLEVVEIGPAPIDSPPAGEVYVMPDITTWSVKTVKSYASGLNPDELVQLIHAEVAGKNRLGLVQWLEDNLPSELLATVDEAPQADTEA